MPCSITKITSGLPSCCNETQVRLQRSSAYALLLPRSGAAVTLGLMPRTSSYTPFLLYIAQVKVGRLTLLWQT